MPKCARCKELEIELRNSKEIVEICCKNSRSRVRKLEWTLMRIRDEAKNGKKALVCKKILGMVDSAFESLDG